ncbi:hypothetical protein HYDPIDRAFT_29231 [Hydnomerulius pinastri MD-312]|uniref:Uncharacterized protein n=1 Tax=Hydnomerulius pinastri MD-312 TaxID=994086 RepID=A0A0C9W8L9_9AGAM|nr:hypothetical protein HYDPIDRAFT_29231 [Hydnomerulius pinastri MD-312]
MKKLQNSVRNWLNNCDQIKEETRNLTDVAPGSPGYVQYWRKAASALSKTLSNTERQTYVDMAVEWNTKGVPKDVQMKMMMFWGYESDREIFRGIHDYNNSLDDGPTVKKMCPNWDKEPIGSTWEKYLLSAFGATKQASLSTVADSKKKFEVKKAEDGHWNLPPEDFMAASLEQQKRLVRDFMNCCWQDMAGRKGSAPFSKMMKDLREFVDLDARYLPDKLSLKIKDPSHMSKDNVECLLHHWRERQGNQFLQPIFAFKETAKQSWKKTAQTSPNITQITSCNIITMPSKASRPTTTPATPPPNDSPGSIVVVSQQSKAGEPSPNAERTAKVPQLTVTVPMNPVQTRMKATMQSTSGNPRINMEYLGLINILHLTQVKTGSVENTLPCGLDWQHDNFHLPLEGHRWLPKHKSAFGADLFATTGEVRGRAQLVAQALLAGYPFIPPELKGKTIPGHYISGYILPWCKCLSEQLKESHAEGISH